MSARSLRTAVLSIMSLRTTTISTSLARFVPGVATEQNERYDFVAVGKAYSPLERLDGFLCLHCTIFVHRLLRFDGGLSRQGAWSCSRIQSVYQFACNEPGGCVYVERRPGSQHLVHIVPEGRHRQFA